jgi:pimeloyl-ACP methyl ester carboxylesterase
VNDADFDRAVNAFLDEIAVPKHRREPRVAARLSTTAPTPVACRHGDLMAWRVGGGPAVLLVHGFEDDNSLWDPLIDELADRDRALVAFDGPGHGQSEGRSGLGWDFTDAIQEVSRRLGPIDSVVAHSVGAFAVIGAMTEGFAPACCVFVAPPFRAGDRWTRYRDKLGVPDEVVRAARIRYEAAIGTRRAAFNAEAEFARLTARVVVFHSEDDERMPVAETRRVVPTCPNAELRVVAGPGHRRTARDPVVVAEIAAILTSCRRS